MRKFINNLHYCFKRRKLKIGKQTLQNNSIMKTRIASDNLHHRQEGIRTVNVEKFCNFSTGSIVCMCIVTWNMNGKFSYEDLEKLVGGDRKFDILVVGLQEVPRCNIGRMLQEVLVDTHRLLRKSIMQSLQLFVFAPKNYELHMTDIKVDKQGVGGLGGLIGRKKGAVAISMRFKGIRMVFISCHLSAHEGNVEERNSELQKISKSLFSKTYKNPYASPCQITIWLGDLNYRIQGLDTLPVKNLIKKNLHTLLTGNDQLLQEAERGNIFNGYCEGSLDFKPTYKYNVGSNNYDTSHKERTPSWTDRILFKIEKYGDIEAILRSYESMDSIWSSDHKPVKAHICLKHALHHDK